MLGKSVLSRDMAATQISILKIQKHLPLAQSCAIFNVVFREERSALMKVIKAISMPTRQRGELYLKGRQCPMDSWLRF